MSDTRAYETATVLELGARGAFRGRPFRLAGRIYCESTAGGHWNEWTLVFDGGGEASLAETPSSFVLFVDGSLAPPFEALVLGARPDAGFVVVERGEATRVERWGDVPECPRTYRYADLSSTTGASATIDYGDARRRGSGDHERIYVGETVTLESLGLEPRPQVRTFVPAPRAKKPEDLELWLDVGDEGKLGQGRARRDYRVVGIVRRSIRIEGERYTWEEYVLHSTAGGLRWLVVSDGHWNLVEAVPPGLVEETERGARRAGVSYRPWSSGKARLEWATGELPWRAKIGDVVLVRDYVRAPHMLSRESSDHELSWSIGTYLPTGVVAQAFGKRVLPRPTGRAPNQPKSPKRR